MHFIAYLQTYNRAEDIAQLKDSIFSIKKKQNKNDVSPIYLWAGPIEKKTMQKSSRTGKLTARFPLTAQMSTVMFYFNMSCNVEKLPFVFYLNI